MITKTVDFMLPITPHKVSVFNPRIMLQIAHSTHEEQARVWAAGTSDWGRTVGVDKYVKRETEYRDTPTSRGGGNSYWVLTDNTV